MVGFDGITSIDRRVVAEETTMIFKLLMTLGCEQRKGEGVLSPGPFVLQISGPPMT